MLLATPPSTDLLLGGLLKRVSRSFYLSLRVLPDGMRTPVSLAYLLARTADTIADTPGTAEAVKLSRLLALRELLHGQAQPDAMARVQQAKTETLDSQERALLAALPQALELLEHLPAPDAVAVRHLVHTLTDGMVFDLRHFAGSQPGAPIALDNLEALDRYTYLVAGCVGEFWTDIAMRHRPELQHWPRDEMVGRGVAYGKALQMTNVLRDAAQDLAMGRCYLPADMLLQHGMTAADLCNASRRRDAMPLLAELSLTTLGGYRDAAAYVLAVPASCLRLRLASLWPQLIGLRTLALLVQADDWLDPARHVKMPRRAVYGMLLRSVLAGQSDGALQRWIGSLSGAAEAACMRHLAQGQQAARTEK